MKNWNKNCGRIAATCFVLCILTLVLMLTGCTATAARTIKGEKLRAKLEAYSADVRHIYTSKQYHQLSEKSMLLFIREATKNKVYDARNYNCRHFALSARQEIFKWRPSAAAGIVKLTNTHSGILQGASQGQRMDNHMLIWFIDLDGSLKVAEPQRYWWKPVAGKQLKSYKPILYFTK